VVNRISYLCDVRVQGAMALAAGAFGAFNDSFLSLISTGVAILMTGAALASFTASLSGSSEESSSSEAAFTKPTTAADMPSYNELRLADFLDRPRRTSPESESVPATSFESVSTPEAPQAPVTMESTFVEDSYEPSTPPEAETPPMYSNHPSTSSPLEVVNDGAYTDTLSRSAYVDGMSKPLVPATALYSSKGAQLDAAPVPLRTKIERIKAELELHDKFFDEL